MNDLDRNYTMWYYDPVTEKSFEYMFSDSLETLINKALYEYNTDFNSHMSMESDITKWPYFKINVPNEYSDNVWLRLEIPI